MKEIVKVMLAEGIDEETIHEVLDVIEEHLESIDENVIKDVATGVSNGVKKAVNGVKNYFQEKKKMKDFTKKAINSYMGAYINTNKSDAIEASKKLRRLKKMLKTAQGPAREKIINTGRAIRSQGRKQIQNAMNMEGSLRNYLGSHGVHGKKATKYIEAFTRKRNNKVYKIA